MKNPLLSNKAKLIFTNDAGQIIKERRANFHYCVSENPECIEFIVESHKNSDRGVSLEVTVKDLLDLLKQKPCCKGGSDHGKCK